MKTLTRFAGCALLIALLTVGCRPDAVVMDPDFLLASERYSD